MQLSKHTDIVANIVDEGWTVVTMGIGQCIKEDELQLNNQEHFKKEKDPREMNLKLKNDTIQRLIG